MPELRPRGLLLACLTAAAIWPASATAQAEAAAADRVAGEDESVTRASLTLETDLRRQLSFLQDDWVAWIGAFNRADMPTLELTTQSLLAGAAELGFSTLPDLAHAAAARAYVAASEGDFPRAYAALASANAFAPLLPGNAFAEAAVARLHGEYVTAVGRTFTGFVRLVSDPSLRQIWWTNVLRWLLVSVFLGALLFAAVEMASKGSQLLRGLALRLERWLPKPVVAVLVVLIFSWPILLPNGVVWVAALWILGLWRAYSVSERLVAVVALSSLLAAPLLGDLLSARAARALVPAADGLEAFVRGEFRGTLFNDLAEVAAVQGDRPEVVHLVGDVHRRLGQWEVARYLYGELLEDRPGTAAALLELGNYHFQIEEFNRAVDYFKQSAEAESTPQAQFNLSQAYSAIYAFDQAERSLREARDLDDGIVTVWVREGAGRTVPSSGLEGRVAAIISELQRAQSRVELVPRPASLFVALPVLLAGLLLAFLVRPASAQEVAKRPVVTGVAQLLLPGLASAQAGNGLSALVACAALSGLASLPLMARWGLSLPLGFWPGYSSLYVLALGGLLIWLGFRFLFAD